MATLARCPCVASSSSPLRAALPQRWSRRHQICYQAAGLTCPGLKCIGGEKTACAFRSRRFRIYAEASQGAEKSFKTTVELDRLIDTLRETDTSELPKVVLENVLSFDSPFWLRLATRADLCNSADDVRDYEELAASIMTIVEKIVKRTQEKIESSTDVLKQLLNPIIEATGEICWPPRDPQGLVTMRQEIERREKENALDESFLSEVNAQMRQAKEDGDKPGLVAMLQKVLQYYAATVLSNRSYAVKDGQVDKAEALLETVLSADEDHWETLLRTGVQYGGGEVEASEFFKAVDKRIERTLMRTENGSYQQRVLIEYIREIQSRMDALVTAFQSL